jgi:RNA polymerase sigma-19 factor, ECF subfamily
MKSRITQEVLTRFNDRDELAFKEIFYGYFREVFVYIEQYIKDKQESESLCIIIFHKLWSCENTFRDEHAMRLYLFTIAKHESINYTRSKYKRQRKMTAGIDESSFIASEQEFIEMHDLVKSLYEYINDLPPQCQDVISLTLLGLDSKEISKRLGISVSTVDVQRHRAVKKLRIKFKCDKTALFLISIL